MAVARDQLTMVKVAEARAGVLSRTVGVILGLLGTFIELIR